MRMQELRRVHTDRESREEHERSRIRAGEQLQDWSGADAAQAPADAENRAAQNQGRIARAIDFRQRTAQKRNATRSHDRECRQRDGNGAEHGERERRVPCARHIEKGDDVGWVRHPREQRIVVHYDCHGQ